MRDLAAGDADHEMAHRADHQQESEGVADESRDADEDAGGKDDQPVEQLPGRHLSTREPFLGVNEYAKAHASHHERPERAHRDQHRHRPEKADLAGDRDEGGNLRSYEQQATEEEHNAG